MNQGITARWRTRAEVRREDWLADGLVSGFVATFAMTVVLAIAYGVSNALGNRDGNLIERWLFALAHNPVADRTGNGVVLAIGLNLLMGLALALVYARLVEPALGGAGWQKGIIFAVVPWLISVAVVLPLLGGGFLGSAIDAGPLPFLGNLILHVVYGAVLGAIYAIALEEGLEDPAERDNAAAAERGAAIGVVGGLVLGAIAGWLLAPQLGGDDARAAVVLGGALIGAASGIVAGSFLGMGDGRQAARRGD